ncbi:glycosyltransferase family 2 protein [Methanobrevibacter sp.]|uniref:glycosyltransferase family 2 protein n=1 Tax=Methanobrevibacter sp. TaxID=66852 RepID=UPI0026F7ED74|nr:glycosyltransferase family A protein [Methanobrevibacter sp.]
MTKVSVILTAFNEERYIKKAIQSILDQTLTDFELIIVNDGSTDSTLDIIKSFDDERIILISQENAGPGASRNRALKLAKGEYTMYLDGDDWYSEDALQIAYDEAKSKDTDFTFYQMINYDDKTGEVYENDWFNLNIFDESFENTVFNIREFKGSIFDLSVGVCQKIYNTSFLKDIGAEFPEGIFFEDMPFFYYVLLKADRISIIKKHLYFRRKHDASITHVVDEKFLDTVPAGQELMRIFIENEWYDAYKFDLLAYKINGPRFALRDIKENYKIPLYELIKKDYCAIKDSQYYQDYLDNLGPVKRKFFLDIIKSKDYEDFRTLNQA